MASALSRDTSDHVPYLVSITTDIPKAGVFRFENFWLQRADFMQVMEHGCSIPIGHFDQAKRVVAKFKNLRRVLRARQCSNLKS